MGNLVADSLVHQEELGSYFGAQAMASTLLAPRCCRIACLSGRLATGLR
jgi:hypothetical protein